MKILLLDVETSPNLATVWGIWQQNISLNQLHETSRVMCYTAKWYKDANVIFDSEHQSDHYDMISGLHKHLSEADAVVHYNGNKFDMPVINRELLRYSLGPPTPYKNIDLLQVVKKQFRFVSNKLDHVVQELGIGKKVATGGHELWLDCMAGDEAAWERMERYNRHDVTILEGLYDRLMPWITNHPNHGLHSTSAGIVCTNCGGDHVQKRGIETTKTQSYQRYQCVDCHTWMRGRHTLVSRERSPGILIQVP
jgi:DNA polymerase elongation subunit (family B)